MSIFLKNLRTVDDLIDPAELKDISIKTEMIDFQKNDYIVDKLADLFGELYSVTKDMKHHLDAYRDPSSRSLLQQIEQVASSRFGLNIKVIPYTEFMIESTMAVNSSTKIGHNFSAMKANYNSFLDRAKSYYEQQGASPEEFEQHFNFKNDKLMEDIEQWELDLVTTQTAVTSINAITEQMNTFGVVVDRKNAVIKNLPKDYINLIYIDYQDTFGGGSREAVSSFLHEVGHAFTMIEYGGKYVNSVSALIDGFYENYQKRNKSPKESLLLAYKTAFKDNDVDKIKDKNVISVYLYVMSNTFKYGMSSLTESEMHGSIDCEHLADQFANRFGLELERTRKLGRYVRFRGSFLDYNTKYILATFFLTVATVLAPPLVMVTGLVIPVLLGIMAVSWYDATFTWGDYQWTGYDDMDRRVKRTRNDLVKRLREFKDDKLIVQKCLQDLEDIDYFIANAQDIAGRNNFNKIKSPVNRMLTFFFKDRRYAVNIKQVEQVQEDLISNELYVASAKLNQLKGV